MRSVEEPTLNLRILGVSAHPHDWTWYAGTLGIHIRRGDQATVCIVSHGGTTHREEWQDELRKPEAERNQRIVNEPVERYIEQKDQEMREAAALFGVTDVRMLGFPDKPFLIERYPEVIDRIADLILEIRPHVIISESPGVSGDTGVAIAYRNDHTEVGKATMEAQGRAATLQAGSRAAPHRVACTFWPGHAPSEVNFVVELSEEWFEKRVQAELLYKSQGHDEPWARRRMLIDLGGMGWLVRARYGEGFARGQREVLSGLPVPRLMIERAAEASSERIERLSQL